MKRVVLFSLILTSLSIHSKEKAKLSCLDKYKKSLSKKEKRYNNAMKRYRDNRSRAISNMMSPNFGNQLLGSAAVQNLKPPSIVDYNMYEKNIILSVEIDLDKNLPTDTLQYIYNEAYEKYSDVTFKKIQNIMLKGFLEGKFCGILGPKAKNSIKRYVLKQLKTTSKDSVQVREPAVINFKEDGKWLYEEEINKPLENKGILE